MCADGTIRIWKTAKPMEMLAFAGPAPGAQHDPFTDFSGESVKYAPDGKTVVAVHWKIDLAGGLGGSTNKMAIWDAATGKQIRSVTTNKDVSRLGPVFSPDGKLIAAFGVKW